MGNTNSCDHEHDFELEDCLKPYSCNGCKEKGFGNRYRCKKCDINLHEVCMCLSAMDTHTIEHEFYKDSTFKFFDQPPKRKCNEKHCNTSHHKIHCDACGKLVQGFDYYCKESGLDLHPCCSNLENKLNIGGVEFQIRYGVTSNSKCIWCHDKEKFGDSKVPGWSYVSENENYNFHVYCVRDMMVKVLAELEKKKDGMAEAQKNGTKPYDLLALVNLELAIQAHRNRGNDNNNKYWSIVKIIFKTIVSTLLGDPTGLLWLVVDIVRN